MGCNCGGGRLATTAATGQAVAWRLFHPSGGTVDYYDPARASKAQEAIPGSYVEKVDVRTGQKVA